MRWGLRLFAIAMATGSLCAAGASRVSASASGPPPAFVDVGPPPVGVAVGGFAEVPGAFDLVYANGRVWSSQSPSGSPVYGDASSLRLNGPIVGAAAVPFGRCERGNCGGYWLAGADGGVFTFGPQGFFGSMAGSALNQPVIGIAATRSGKGYFLVARDGGVFTFGDAQFRGSAATLRLNRPIVGITTGTTGGPPHRAYRGYRLVARDGGVFSFGGAPFYGSLPGRGITADDVVGMAPTPTNKGYWIARSDGRVYHFGDAGGLGNASPPSCDPITAIIANPKTQGYRLVTRSGATFVFGGLGLGGHEPTGRPNECPMTAF